MGRISDRVFHRDIVCSIGACIDIYFNQLIVFAGINQLANYYFLTIFQADAYGNAVYF